MKKILVVEDDEHLSSALAIRLGRSGYQVLTASDSSTCLTEVMRHNPDLVVMDVMLPKGNGITLGERLVKLSPKPPSLIFLTASELPGLREKAEAMGAVGYFQKPCDPARLLETIQRALGETK